MTVDVLIDSLFVCECESEIPLSIGLKFLQNYGKYSSNYPGFCERAHHEVRQRRCCAHRAEIQKRNHCSGV